MKYTEAGFAIHSEPAGKGREKKRKQKNPGINPRQPARKGQKKKKKKPWYKPWAACRKREGKKKKKTLVLTLGSSLEKGGKKKKKKKKKDLGINPGQRHLKYIERSCSSVRRGPETQNRDLDRRTDAQTMQLI